MQKPTSSSPAASKPNMQTPLPPTSHHAGQCHCHRRDGLLQQHFCCPSALTLPILCVTSTGAHRDPVKTKVYLSPPRIGHLPRTAISLTMTAKQALRLTKPRRSGPPLVTSPMPPLLAGPAQGQSPAVPKHTCFLPQACALALSSRWRVPLRPQRLGVEGTSPIHRQPPGAPTPSGQNLRRPDSWAHILVCPLLCDLLSPTVHAEHWVVTCDYLRYVRLCLISRLAVVSRSPLCVLNNQIVCEMEGNSATGRASVEGHSSPGEPADDSAAG